MAQFSGLILTFSYNLKSELTALTNLVFTELLWFNLSPCCGNVLVQSSTLLHHFVVKGEKHMKPFTTKGSETLLSYFLTSMLILIEQNKLLNPVCTIANPS